MTPHRRNRRTLLMGSTASLVAGVVTGIATSPAVAEEAEEKTGDVAKIETAQTQTAQQQQQQTQTQTGAQASQLEEIVVTGSRIARPDLSAPSPVNIVGSEEFQLQGTVNVEDVLNDMPQLIPATDSTSNNPGNGAATLDLRGLGVTRTLVLVNGKRWLSFDTNNTVDVNTIPDELIERVDVLTGGASATYGSDAVGGVVNFILKDDFEGVSLNAQYDVTARGDAERQSYSALMGGNFADGRGNAVVFAEYSERDPLKQGDRKFSTFAAGEAPMEPGTFDKDFNVGEFGDGDEDDVPGFVPFGSSGIPGTRLFGGPLFDSNDDGEFDTPIGRFSPDGEPRVFQSPEDTFNYAPDNFLQLPQERWTIHGQADFEVNDSVELFLEATFSRNTVDAQLAPTPFFEPIDVDADSPFLSERAQEAFINADQTQAGTIPPGGQALPANEPGDGFVRIPLIGRRLKEVGPRQNIDERNAFRIMGGARGELGDFGEILQNAEYEAFYMFGDTTNTQRQRNNVAISRMEQALRTTFNENGELVCQDQSGGCVPINIFGEGNISEEAADFVRLNAINVDTAETQNAGFTVNGDSLNLTGAGRIGFAGGIEYRQESASFQPDSFLATGNVAGFNAGAPTSGSFDVWEFFAEIQAPIVRDAPLIDSWDINAAVRQSDYSTVGAVTTWTLGSQWAPTENLTIRGQFQRAIRAPNVEELFAGVSQGFPGAVDPCSNRFPQDQRTETIRQLCIANGVPADNVFTEEVQPNSQIEGTFSGNPDLEEEESDTWTAGIVWSPDYIPGLNVTADYYSITVDDAVGLFLGGVNNILRNCFLQAQDNTAESCQAINRFANGNIDTVDTPNDNVAALETSGVDFTMDYSMDLPYALISRTSALEFQFSGTWLDEFVTTPATQFPNETNQCADQFGNTCGEPLPEFKTRSRLTYNDGPFTLSWQWRWIDSVKDDRIVNDNVDPETLFRPSVDGEHYFDISGQFQATENLRLSFTAENVFDNQPPGLGDSQEQANTFPATYDPFGARFILGANVTF